MNDSLILTLCVQENTLLISNAIIEQLGSPSLIQIRMNEEDKSLLVNPCEYGVRGAVVVPENRKYQLEMPDRSLIRRIQRITEWPDDNPRVLCGVFIPRLNAIYFIRTVIRIYSAPEEGKKTKVRAHHRPGYNIPMLVLTAINLFLGLFSWMAAELVQRGLMMFG